MSYWEKNWWAPIYWGLGSILLEHRLQYIGAPSYQKHVFLFYFRTCITLNQRFPVHLIDPHVTHKTWFYHNFFFSFLSRILKIKFWGSNILEPGSNILEPPNVTDWQRSRLYFMPLLLFISCRQYIYYFALSIVIFTSSTSSPSSTENKTKESGLLPAPSVTLQEKRNSKSLPLLSHSSKLLKHDYFSKTSCIQNKTQEKEIMSFVHLAGQNLSVAISGISVVAKFASHFAHFDHFSGSPSNLCRKVSWANLTGSGVWNLFAIGWNAQMWWFCYYKEELLYI